MSHRNESVVFGLTVASAAATLVSIAVSQIFLASACAIWLYTRPGPIRFPTYFLPLLAFFLSTILSLALSPNPGAGLAAVYKFWLFVMGLLAANFVTTAQRARTAMRVLIGVAAGAALVAIVQFAFLYARYQATGELADNPMAVNRITGTLGHWMTFSGGQLLVWCMAAPALAVLGRRWIPPAAIVSTAIILSFTRSAWLGSAAGFVAAARTLPRRVILAVLAPVVVAGAAASGLVYERVTMSFQADFAPNYARKAYLDVGLRMIRDNPLAGVGPGRIAEEFPRYYDGDNLDQFYYGHLHNNFVQIAAERGLIALGAALWFFVELYRSLIRMFRTASPEIRWLPMSAISALTGFLVGGAFEYNFSDSEVLMLLLFIVSIHFGVVRGPVLAADEADARSMKV